MLKILTEVSRVLVGTIFIISGLVKSNDIWGFVYKLEENRNQWNKTKLCPLQKKKLVF